MLKRIKKRTCNIYDCKNELYMGGLCEVHFKEDKIKRDRRDTAIRTLHSCSINDSLPTNKNLHKELEQLCERWSEVCSVLNNNRGTELIPLDEAKNAKDWCITLAQEIIDAELAFRLGKKANYSLENTRKWVWDRFRNLEAGLASNGLKRNS